MQRAKRVAAFYTHSQEEGEGYAAESQQGVTQNVPDVLLGVRVLGFEGGRCDPTLAVP